MAFGNSCYSYSDSSKLITWSDAYDECQRRGAVLASLNTPEEWSAVEDALDFGHRASYVFIGLRTADPNLPALYRKTWQWADLSFFFMEGVETIVGIIDYDPALFKETTVLKLIAAIQQVSAAIVSQPGKRLGNLEIGD